MTKKNVVIGGGSGMGAAAATLLAPLGPLIVADLDADRVAEVVAGLPGDPEGLAVDITDADAVDALVAATDELGSLVITAGLSPSTAGGRRIWEVNLIALTKVLAAFESALRPGSAAVVFASIAGHMVPSVPEIDAIVDDPLSPTFFEDLAAAGFDPDDSQMAYAVSKYGVIRLVRRQAAVWGTHGARLLSLSPGIINTGMGQLEASNEPSMADMVAGAALTRMAEPEELASVAVFLVSDQASFMTGADVLVDGGVIASRTS